MKERVAKLLTIKSIVTIIFTAVFAYLAISGSVDAEQYITLYTMIVAFYFGTQAVKEA